MKVQLKSKYITISLHVMIWGMLLLLPYIVSNAHNGYKIGNLPWPYFTLSDFIHIAVFYFNAFYLFPKFLDRSGWWMYLVGSFLVILASIELKLLMQTLLFPEIKREYTTYRFILVPSIGTFVISSIYRIILDRIRMEKEQKERQAAQLATELKFLRSQISPHFLFNVLTNLVSLARKRSDKLEPSLIMLSDLMRYMLYDTQGKKVELGTEIEYLSSYVELQKLRFGNDVDITSRIGASEQDRTFLIEPMLLIPFVENAFKHGVGFADRSRIDIHLSVGQGYMSFGVQNTFDKTFAGGKEESNGLGLKNVVSRLNLLYQDQHTLTIRDYDNLFDITLTLKLMMRCMVIDDEQLVRELLEDNIRQIPFLQCVKSCKNALEAMEALQTTPADLLFLDIQMPRVNGLQFLQALTDPPLVILVTAYEQYALEGFNLRAVDYLLKPFAFDRFLKACNRADELFRLRQNDKTAAAAEPQDFFVNVEYTLVKVNVTDILFIEGVKDYIKIYLASSQRPVLTRMTLKAMEEKLPPPAFIRTHKSFLVSVRQITAVKRDMVCIGSKEIPVSVSYKANVNRVIIDTGAR